MHVLTAFLSFNLLYTKRYFGQTVFLFWCEYFSCNFECKLLTERPLKLLKLEFVTKNLKVCAVELCCWRYAVHTKYRAQCSVQTAIFFMKLTGCWFTVRIVLHWDTELHCQEGWNYVSVQLPPQTHSPPVGGRHRNVQDLSKDGGQGETVVFGIRHCTGAAFLTGIFSGPFWGWTPSCREKNRLLIAWDIAWVNVCVSKIFIYLVN
jgi:hypothetical protein